MKLICKLRASDFIRKVARSNVLIINLFNLVFVTWIQQRNTLYLRIMIDTPNWIENTFFARHETFAPRYGWLKKGFDAVLSHGPDIFDSPYAIEHLGVGKNMVRAMRFWCMAYNVLEPTTPAKPLRLAGNMKVTEFGDNLFNNSAGWDPFLEDDASLWLLHWQLFMPPVIATSWPFILNNSLLGKFSAKDLAANAITRIDQCESIKRFSTASVEKDASCFIRMYGASRSKNSDEIECPFVSLGLLSSAGKSEFEVNPSDKPTLPNKIFLAACFDFANHTQSTLRTISLHKLAYAENSPGILFRLSESEVGRRLESGLKNVSNVDFIESYGNRQIQFDEHPDTLKEGFLRSYYS